MAAVWLLHLLCKIQKHDVKLGPPPPPPETWCVKYRYIPSGKCECRAPSSQLCGECVFMLLAEKRSAVKCVHFTTYSVFSALKLWRNPGLSLWCAERFTYIGRLNTRGVQVLRYPNFFFSGNGSR